MVDARIWWDRLENLINMLRIVDIIWFHSVQGLLWRLHIFVHALENSEVNGFLFHVVDYFDSLLDRLLVDFSCSLLSANCQIQKIT